MGLDNQISIPAPNKSNLERGASLRDAKARIPKNVIFNFTGYAVNILVVFLIAPVLVHRLGNTAYGIWGLITQILGYSFLLDFGIRIAVTRYVGRHLALDEPRQINTVLTTGLAFTSISFVLALVGGGVAAYLLPRYFSIPSSLVSDARLAVLIIAAAFASSFPGSLFTGTAAALSRYDFLSLRNSGLTVLRALLLWFFLVRGYGLLSVAIITGTAWYLGLLLDYLFVSRRLPGFAIRREFFDFGMLRTLVSFSFYAFVLSISWRLLYVTDNVVVGFVLGPAAVTFYTIGVSLADMLRSSLGNISNLFSPLASQMDALDQKESLRQLFFRGSRVSLLYALPGVATLTVVGPSFLGFWMGEAFVSRTGPVLIVLAAEVACFALAYTCGQVLYGMNRHKTNAWLSLVQAATNLALSTILVRWWGAVGVAWGTLIPAFAVEAIILPAYTASVLQASLRRFYVSAMLRPLTAALPYAAWLWYWRTQGLIRGYLSLALAVGSGLIVYGLIAWLVGIDSEDRKLARRFLANLKSALVGIRPAWAGPRGE